MSEEISNNKLLEKIEEWIIHQSTINDEMFNIQNEQTVEIDNKIDRILKEFDYLRDSVSRIEHMKEENKIYYDSLTAKIHLFYLMFWAFVILMIWLH